MIGRAGDFTTGGVPLAFIRDLGAASTLQEVLDVGATWSLRIVNGATASISLVAKSGDHLEIATETMTQLYAATTRVNFHNTLSGRAFLERRQLSTPSLAASSLGDAQLLRQAGLQSAIFTPLISGDECYGTLNVSHKATGYFNADHVEFLSSVALLLASFIDLHERARKSLVAARTDPLTGLLNRAAIVTELEKQWARHEKTTVIFIDFDDFKALNDVQGHLAGNEVLRVMAARFAAVIGDGDSIGRFGGDEFLVVAQGASSAQNVEDLIEKLTEKLGSCDDPVMVNSGPVKPRYTMGLASQPFSRSAKELIIDADHAMYEAKRLGLRSLVADAVLRGNADVVTAIDGGLQSAMQTGQLFFVYQPIVAIGDGRILGAESLLRWDHPTLGFLPPETIIRRVIADAYVEQFTLWALDTICTEWAAMSAHNPELDSLYLGFNAAEPQIAWADYPDAHLAALARHGLDVRHVVLEVVESEAIAENQIAERNLRTLAEHDVRIALDDFGTGANALTYFTRFPIEILKIDRSLISILPESDIALKIVEDLTRLAQALDLFIVAEGVETKQQSDLCRSLGVDSVQGWYYSEPLRIKAFAELARSDTIYVEN